MATCKPHYLLFCDGCLLPSGALHTEARGRWRFVLEDIVTGAKTEASDCEPSDHLDRVSLLAVTRGLEALEQPSRVTLITTSRYVARGLQYGLVEWRENDYCWEHFGSIQPIRNADLWRRVDVALKFHEVQCRWMSQESPLREEPVAASVSTELATVLRDEDTDLLQSSPRDAGVATLENSALQSVAIGDFVRDDSGKARSVASNPDQCPERRAVVSASIPAIRELPDSGEESAPLRTFYPPAEERLQTAARLVVPPPTSTETVLPLPSRPRQLISGASRPIYWVWNVILAVDAFLVSCLRCLFLLDPRRDHFRRRNY